jgi:predicted unusual protein kinase regulating ubiquinone biosynthesis (AarF/ABC1/UbiB family)
LSERDAGEANRLTGRVSRYARVGASVGRVAARMGAERLFGLETNNAEAAAALRGALGGLKGPLMKVAQLLATIPDALPAEYAGELAQLQSNAPPMGWPFVRRRMMAELGPDWQKNYKSFEHEAAAAASLGQVHRAVGHDGKKLACKLQYPDMQSAVEADLTQLKIIFAVYRRYDKAIDPSRIHDEIAARLREELDYEREARHQSLYRIMLADEELVHVPEVVPELSTRRLLTMDWMDGEPLMNFKGRSLEERGKLAMAMFRAWYVPFYGYGVIHGDPHLGNYKVMPDMSVNLLDFGCVRVFHPKFVQGVIDLYNALETDDRDLAVHAYETWGFTGLSNEVIDTLHLWAEFIYAPLLDDTKRAIHDEGSMYGATVASKVHARLRELGGVTVPREFVFMDRAAIGLGSVFMHLEAEVNWHRMFKDLIAGFDEKKLAKRQAQAMDEVGLEPPA